MSEQLVLPDVPAVAGPEIDVGLQQCLQDLYHGPWQFIQLRGAPPGPQCVAEAGQADVEDIDLLGTESSLRRLMDAVLQWVQAGRCHARLVRNKPGKAELTLLSPDGRQRVQLDVWLSLTQLAGGRFRLTWRHCAERCGTWKSSIQRLPCAIEACLYVQHLVAKGKNLRSPRVQQRLLQYADQCGAAGFLRFEESLRTIRQLCCVPRETLDDTLQYVRRTCQPDRVRWSPLRMLHKLRVWGLRQPRRRVLVSVMGCDGVGKTSLTQQMAAHSTRPVQVLTGKHLYRKSLLYKLVVILLRPVLGRGRDRLDDLLAPLLYLRASAALRVRLLLADDRLCLMDRALADFLLVQRKTDTPRFHRCHWLTQLAGCRVPVVHCIVSRETLRSRKQEMTVSGHQQYDRTMLRHHVRSIPVDYMAFGNDRPLPEATGLLQRLLELGGSDSAAAASGSASQCLDTYR